MRERVGDVPIWNAREWALHADPRQGPLPLGQLRLRQRASLRSRLRNPTGGLEIESPGGRVNWTVTIQRLSMNSLKML